MATWSSTWEGDGLEFPDLPVASPSDIDEFLEDGRRSSENLATGEGRRSGVWDGDDEEKEDASSAEESKKFWESQYQLLQAVLRRSSNTESRIRSATKESLKEIEMSADEICDCQRPTAVTGGSSCRNCLMEKVSSRLRKAGFNIAICKSKWTSSPYIPSGEHKFLDVLETTKKGVARVIIELNFRAEFEMARASEEYNGLVRQLPEVFIGKVERLQSIIRILCTAAKKCMKDQHMHIGPWRKQRYMEAKWLGPYERISAPLATLPIGLAGRPRKPRASMLTVGLTGKLPGMHCTPVEVV